MHVKAQSKGNFEKTVSEIQTAISWLIFLLLIPSQLQLSERAALSL